jgi:hypothetical protein
MTGPTNDLPLAFPIRPELTGVALFARAIDTQLTGNEKLLRAMVYRLTRLGWRVTPLELPEGGIDL